MSAPLCKTCKFFKPSLAQMIFASRRFAECGHPSAIDDGGPAYWLVTGRARESLPCSVARASENERKCGPAGKYWAPKRGRS